MEWLILPDYISKRERWQLWLRIPGENNHHPRFIFVGSKGRCFDIVDAAKKANVHLTVDTREE